MREKKIKKKHFHDLVATAMFLLFLSQFVFVGYVAAQTPRDTLDELYERAQQIQAIVTVLESGGTSILPGKSIELRQALNTIRAEAVVLSVNLTTPHQPAPVPGGAGGITNEPPPKPAPVLTPSTDPKFAGRATPSIITDDRATPANPLSRSGFLDLLNKISSAINLVVSFVVGLAVFVVIWGIFTYLTHAAEEEKRAEAKRFIVYGTIGVFLMLSIWGFVNILLNTFTLDRAIDRSSIPNVPSISP